MSSCFHRSAPLAPAAGAQQHEEVLGLDLPRQSVFRWLLGMGLVAASPSLSSEMAAMAMPQSSSGPQEFRTTRATNLGRHAPRHSIASAPISPRCSVPTFLDPMSPMPDLGCSCARHGGGCARNVVWSAGLPLTAEEATFHRRYAILECWEHASP